MVRLIDKNNLDQISGLAYILMRLQGLFTYIANINHPSVTPCIYAMWHENQFCVHGIPNRKNLNLLISNSIDGEIVARVCGRWGYKICRGSSKRKGAVSGTLKMISKLKEGENIAIMVDGPRGPVHKVKAGAVMLSREANVPIVPVCWYSPNFTFVKFPSWDKMTSPVGPCWLVNVYGDPIYPEGKSDEQIAQEVRDSLLELQKNIKDNYKEAVKQGLWFRKH